MAWVRRELNALGIPPLRRFGQHFLIDREVRRELVESGRVSANDTVLEVGPGLGFLTSELLKTAGQVIAVEKDRTLAPYLRRKFSKHKNLTVIEGDVLEIDLPDYDKMISSPPYNISSKLVFMILNSKYELASLLLQNEFAVRLMSSNGSKDYSRLTVMFQCKARANVVAKVPSTAFYPKPKVESTLVTITPLLEDPPIKNHTLFDELVRALFTQRRRKLSGVLTRYLKHHYPGHLGLILKEISFLDKRVFEISLQEFVTLSNQIADMLD